MPAWFKYHLKKDGPGRLKKFGAAVFGARTAEATIKTFEDWFRKIGAPIRLSEAGIPAPDIPKIAGNAMGLVRRWGMDYDRKTVERILEKAK